MFRTSNDRSSIKKLLSLAIKDHISDKLLQDFYINNIIELRTSRHLKGWKGHIVPSKSWRSCRGTYHHIRCSPIFFYVSKPLVMIPGVHPPGIFLKKRFINVHGKLCCIVRRRPHVNHEVLYLRDYLLHEPITVRPQALHHCSLSRTVLVSSFWFNWAFDRSLVPELILCMSTCSFTLILKIMS